MKRSSAAAANKRRHKQWPYHLMMLPGMIFLIIFHLVPMGGLLMAFQDFMPIKGLFGSRFVGLKNFERLFKLPTFWRVLRNTVVISVGKLVLVMVASVIFALLLNECRHVKYKRIIQTTVYLPHFLSWVILAVMFSNVFSYTGIVSQIAQMFGGEPTMFMISNSWFRKILIGGEIWKEFGYGAIVYVAAITGIDPTLYEAAGIDGAGRWKKMWYITLPSIKPTIMLLLIFAIGGMLGTNTDLILLLYNPATYETADVIGTYVYRDSLLGGRFSFGTAVGLFTSMLNFMLVFIANKVSAKVADYSLW